MTKQKIITGIEVTDQMTRARGILITEVLPKEAMYQERKKNGLLSKL